MGFELVIAIKRDDAAPDPALARERGHYVSIAVDGNFDEAAADTVFLTVVEEFANDANSVLVELDDITAGELAHLQSLALRVMALRGEGREVQVSARLRDVHDRLATLPNARDWLVQYSDAPPESPRRAIHVERLRTIGKLQP